MDILPNQQKNFFQIEPFTADQKISFCKLFSEGKSLQDCISATQINRTTFEYHKKQDRWFKAMLQACRDVHCDDLEAIMLQQGKSPKGFADRSEYLKAYRPEVFAKKHENATIDVTINVDPERLKHYELRQKAIDADLGKPDAT